MLVFHDPGSNNCSTDAMIQYGKTYDKKREGMFGYHFYIAQDGTIYQGAPLAKRTNHVAGAGRRTPLKYSNSSTIGVSLMCGHKKIPEAQLKAAVRLGHLLQVAYQIPSLIVFGHGELQYNRMPNEGIIAARATRTTSAYSPESIRVVKRSSATHCAVSGIAPSPCTGSECEVFARTQRTNEYVNGIPAGLYKILEGNTGYTLTESLSKFKKIPVPETKYGGKKYISGSEIETDARAWGYGEQKKSATVQKDTSLHFGNPLNGLQR
jgi:hypothetical protein